MGISFKLVDVPKVSGGKVAAPNPFEPAAQAAMQAQEQGKAIAFDLDVTGYSDITTEKDGVKTVKTAYAQAEAYVVRKIRELGAVHDRTFTVTVEPYPNNELGGTVTVAAKTRITRAKKSADATAEA